VEKVKRNGEIENVRKYRCGGTILRPVMGHGTKKKKMLGWVRNKKKR